LFYLLEIHLVNFPIHCLLKNHSLIISSEPTNADIIIDDSLVRKPPIILYNYPKSYFKLKLIDEKQNVWALKFLGLNKNEIDTQPVHISRSFRKLAG